METRTNASMPTDERGSERGQWLQVLATGLLVAAVTAIGTVSPLAGL